jgi:hypothetical protein
VPLVILGGKKDRQMQTEWLDDVEGDLRTMGIRWQKIERNGSASKGGQNPIRTVKPESRS